ncbi:MAG: site-specific tyrosine recombinase XerC [Fibrobacteria bacterium]|jgi:integrase|nr:site-specific tyrosine recombinase XerC [Fibrobacteria bacterium]
MNDRLRVYIGPRRKRKAGGYYPRWPYRYQLPGQPWVHGTGTFSEASTRQLVDGLIQEHMIRLRMAERGMTEASTLPVEKHLEDYLKWGKHAGGKGGLAWSAEHLAHRRSQLREWVRVLGVKTLDEIRYDAFSAVNTDRLARGLAPNTVNHHAWAMVSFLSWCRDRGRVSSNPLESFTSLDRRPRRERGAFDAGEFRALLDAAPPARRLVYRVAAFSGLRRSAIASLRVGDVDFAAGLVTLRWGAAKNRKETVKPLPPRLLLELKAACEARGPQEPLLEFTPRQAARGIHRDMKAAGIALVGNGGRRDFHSLKASLGTLLDDMGTPPEITQRALDHASFLQTRGYIKRDLGSLRLAVDGLEAHLETRAFPTNEDAELEGLYLLGETSLGRGSTHSDLLTV